MVRAKLSGATLNHAQLPGANLGGADLAGADLRLAALNGAHLVRTDLREANLEGAMLHGADLTNANLAGAKLAGARLNGANLAEANLTSARLDGADLRVASLVDANLEGAVLTGCRVYGISIWRARIDNATQQDGLIITSGDEPEVTTDNLELAQFLYLMLHNEKIRSVIDTITSKVVLILGRFSPDRKIVLDLLRNELRQRHNYVPVVFDFEKSSTRTTVETITLLARMARFVISDISDAKSVLQELQAIVPVCTSVPVQPIIQTAQEVPGMFDSFLRYPWFLGVQRYDDPSSLLAQLNERVIAPAEAKVEELRHPTRYADQR